MEAMKKLGRISDRNRAKLGSEIKTERFRCHWDGYRWMMKKVSRHSECSFFVGYIVWKCLEYIGSSGSII